ncbi:MAG: hypothetical protein KDC52_19135 [Ignavibacteriae bacterium]|nr:hypothetical protein [Ignavibacteriota bacterium]MCB0753594.1 hypothetical protein [Ignavibacteriota bacterium]
MEFYLIIAFISTLVWLTMPIVYRNNRHFYFFLFLALNDSLSIILWTVFSVSSQLLWIPIHYLILLSYERYWLTKYKFWILIGFIPILILTYFSTTKIQLFYVLVTNIALFLLFVKPLVVKFFNSHLNLFYLVMSFYELITITKLIIFIKKGFLGMEAFYIGTIFQIIMGIVLIYIGKFNKELTIVSEDS